MDIRLWEVGEKRRLNSSYLKSEQTDRERDRPEGWGDEQSGSGYFVKILGLYYAFLPFNTYLGVFSLYLAKIKDKKKINRNKKKKNINNIGKKGSGQGGGSANVER